jgi:hypothetical protein
LSARPAFAILEGPREDNAMATLLPLLLALSLQAEPAREDVPIPPKVQAEVPAEDEVPEVAIRVERNGDRVEEYRQNGVLYMVKVTPERGPPYYLMDTDGNGRLNPDMGDPRIQPVHWVIYEWD